jgi:ribosomal protein S18 acetylase RimI-like enzyme
MSHEMPSEPADASLQVADLRTVEAAELADLWEHELRLWRDHLRWDVSGRMATVRRLIDRGALAGKAVRLAGRVVGYTSFGIAGRRGAISSFVLSPSWGTEAAAQALLRATVDELRRQGAQRIESSVVASACPWLAPAFERQGFRTYWRDFLRLELEPGRRPAETGGEVQLEPWRDADLYEAAAILQAAYAGGVEAEMYELYRSAEGCQRVLDEILRQAVCGIPLVEASALARYRGRRVGLIAVTQIAPQQAHLAQVAVLPEFQRRGIGRSLLDYSLARLTERRFATLSLIVSRANAHALKLYRALGFQTVLACPAFVWGR